jgi:AcrR family transcriptional regulator
VPRPPHISSEQLADAVIRLVVAGGLEAVSVRNVAREAGVSVGAVQYHFATKDDLLLAAYERAIDRVALKALEIAEQASEPLAYVRGLLQELLPLDARRDAELRVALAFSARSVHSPRLAALYAQAYAALVDAVAGALAEANPALDARGEATAAVALADGLAWHLQCAPGVLGPEEALAALDAHLAGLAPGADYAPGSG